MENTVCNCMRTILIATSIILFTLNGANAQKGLTLNSYVVGSKGADIFNGIDETKDHGLVFGGTYQKENDNGQTIFNWFIGRLHPNMEAKWIKSISAEANSSLLKVKALNSGEVLAIGIDGYLATLEGGKKKKMITPSLIRMNDKGEIIYEWRYADSNGKYMEDSGRDLYAVEVMPNGDILMSGYYVDIQNLSNRVQAWVCRINAQGDIIWEGLYGKADDELIQSIASTPDGGAVLAGTMRYMGDSSNEGLLIRIDGHGKQLWRKQFAEEDGKWIRAIAVNNDGSIAIAGTFRKHTPENIRGSFVSMLDQNGKAVWERKTTGSADRDPASIAVARNGDIVVTGSTTPGLRGESDIFVSRYSQNGRTIFDKTLGGKGVEIPTSIIQLSDGKFAVSGQTSSTKRGDSDGLIFTAGPRGDLPEFGN